MKAFESWIFACWLNSLWQIALVFAVAWIAAHFSRRMGPRVEHRIWVAALLLQVTLPFCTFRIADLLGPTAAESAGGSVRVTVGEGVSHASSMLQIPAAIIAIIVAAYLCSFLYFTVRIVWALAKTRALLRSAEPLHANRELSEKLDRYSALFSISRQSVQLAVSSSVSGPVAVGVRHATLLLPAALIGTPIATDLDAVFAHEFAHLKRNDFAKNLFYEFLILPFAWHPLLRITRTHIAGTREMVCDAMASETALGHDRYAHALLRLAAQLANHSSTHPLPAIGIFDAGILERRIMNLKQKHETRKLHRFAVAVLCGAAAIATCTSALAFRIHTDPDQKAVAEQKTPKRLSVSAGVMQGNILEKVQPQYPVEAKKAKIQGTVTLAAVIGKDGTVQNLRVKAGPSELQHSAIDAVRQWRYKPFLLNGNPVEVETEINVTYSLAG